MAKNEINNRLIDAYFVPMAELASDDFNAGNTIIREVVLSVENYGSGYANQYFFERNNHKYNLKRNEKKILFCELGIFSDSKQNLELILKAKDYKRKVELEYLRLKDFKLLDGYENILDI